MKINNKNPIKHIIPLFLIISIIISSCGPLAYKRADVKDVPVNEADKRKKNIEVSSTFGGIQELKLYFLTNVCQLL